MEKLLKFLGLLKVFDSFYAKFTFLKSFYWVFIILCIQYYSVICRPSDHIVGRPWA